MTKDKKSFTGTLIISANSEMCKLIITIIGKTPRSLKKLNIHNNEVIGTISKNGWINEHIMKLALDEIYKITKNKKGVLLLDQFTAHTTDNIKDYAKSKNIELIYVPIGMTDKYQLLDVNINGIIKEIGIKSWKNERINNPDKFITQADSLKHFIAACKCVTEDHIRDAFKKTTIFDNLVVPIN
jgi:hypothetical protein